MGHYVGDMEHRSSALRVPLYRGWSWPFFFFGPFWYMAKGMWGHAILLLLVFWVLWVPVFVLAFIANRQYAEWLASRNYRMATERSSSETMLPSTDGA